MRTPPYHQVQNGEELEVPNTWIVACCDCGLVHRFEFRCKKDKKGKGYTFVVKVFRDNRRTASKRRHKDYDCKPKGTK